MNPIDRRKFFGLSAAAVTVAASGCVPGGDPEIPDLVWGRWGFSDGRFTTPRAITIDESDQLFIVDKSGRIQVFDVDGNFIRGWSTPDTANGRPTGLSYQTAAMSPDGRPRILVADTHYYRVIAYTPQGEQIESATIGGTAGSSPGQFAFVTDAVSDADGCVYVGEYNASDRIQKFDPDGRFICQWGGTGESPGKFIRPQSLVITGDVMWIADACNHRIQQFDLSQKTPELIDVWGGPGTDPGQYFFPYDLTIAADGSVLVVEYKNNRVQRLSPTGDPIGVWGNPGTLPGQLNQPWGVVVDSRNRAHVLDSYNNRVQRIELPDRLPLI